jgi:hypothetical protein
VQHDEVQAEARVFVEDQGAVAALDDEEGVLKVLGAAKPVDDLLALGDDAVDFVVARGAPEDAVADVRDAPDRVEPEEDADHEVAELSHVAGAVDDDEVEVARVGQRAHRLDHLRRGVLGVL